MAKEIERKFLVKGDAWRSFAKGTTYRQGYLNRPRNAPSGFGPQIPPVKGSADTSQNPPKSSYRARNRCRFRGPARASGERTLCGLCLRRCAAVLLHADEGQVDGVLIHYAKCGSYNLTEA
jgi:ribosomal protein S14